MTTPIEAAVTLANSLPDDGWYVAPLGKQGALAVYPPKKPSAEHFRTLSAVADISAVCGCFYVVIPR